MNEHRKRRWFQFRLRTLLVAVTLAAVSSAACLAIPVHDTQTVSGRAFLVRTRGDSGRRTLSFIKTNAPVPFIRRPTAVEFTTRIGIAWAVILAVMITVALVRSRFGRSAPESFRPTV